MGKMATQSNPEEAQAQLSQVDNLTAEVENLKADIAALKAIVPAPRGFASWKQFDAVVNDAWENQ